MSGVWQSRRFSDISDEKDEEEEIGRGDGWKRSAIRKFLRGSVETDKDEDEEDKDVPKSPPSPLLAIQLAVMLLPFMKETGLSLS